MKVRELRLSDIPALERWHRASGFDYPFPDLRAPEFERVTVIVDEHDQPVQALAAKRTIEMYLLADQSWRNPRWRLEAFAQGHEEMRQQLLARGYRDANCWLPPEIERAFGRRLTGIFQWVRSRWTSYSRRLED